MEGGYWGTTVFTCNSPNQSLGIRIGDTYGNLGIWGNKD